MRDLTQGLGHTWPALASSSTRILTFVPLHRVMRERLAGA